MKYGSIPLMWWWGLLMKRMATVIQIRQCSTMTPAPTPQRWDLLPAEWDVKAPHRWNTFLTQKYTFLTHQLTQDGVFRLLRCHHQAQVSLSGWWKFPIIMQKETLQQWISLVSLERSLTAHQQDATQSFWKAGLASRQKLSGCAKIMESIITHLRDSLVTLQYFVNKPRNTSMKWLLWFWEHIKANVHFNKEIKSPTGVYFSVLNNSGLLKISSYESFTQLLIFFMNTLSCEVDSTRTKLTWIPERQMPQENNKCWKKKKFHDRYWFISESSNYYFPSCSEKSMEKHKRSCYETMESHGEDTSCRGPSFQQPLEKENLWRAALQKRSWFWPL